LLRPKKVGTIPVEGRDEYKQTNKKSGKSSQELIFGITGKTPEQASAEQVLATNRGHWVIENVPLFHLK